MTALHSLTRSNKDARSNTRVGRGGRRGKTSGRGTKGQNARAGNKKRPEIRDMIKKFPKLRGHGKNRARTVNTARVIYSPVSLSIIEKSFADGDTVSPLTLVEKKLVAQRGKKLPSVVILANGSLKKKVSVNGVRVTNASRVAIEAAGGTVAV